MRSISTGQKYAERCQDSERGNIVARLEVTAHRVMVFTRDFADSVHAYPETHTAARALDEYVRHESEYNPLEAQRLCGEVANRLAKLSSQHELTPERCTEVTGLWEKLSHVQYLIAVLYPIYVGALKEAYNIQRGGLPEYGEQMQQEIEDILAAASE